MNFDNIEYFFLLQYFLLVFPTAPIDVKLEGIVTQLLVPPKDCVDNNKKRSNSIELG